MELRSRSRSKTPFMQAEIIESDGENDVSSVTRITRQTTLKTIGSIISDSLDENYSTQIIKPSTKIRSEKKNRVQSYGYKTSDYSSEDGDNEISSIQHITENDKNQIIEDARAAANGNAQVSALNLYRKAGRYWDKYPKTDWTYSPHSRDRVEIAPGVVAMPNMSRRTIHSYDSPISTDISHKYTTTTTTTNSDYNYIKPQQLFTNNNTEEDSFHIKRVSLSSRVYTSVLIIYTMILNGFYYIYETPNSWIIWSGAKLHRFVSRIMLLDTWLLRKTTTKRNKIKKVIILCLIPLLLFGGWWLLSNLGQSIYETFNNLPASSPMNDINSLKTDNGIKTTVEEKSSRNIETKLSTEQLETIALAIKNSLQLENNENIQNNFILNEKMIKNLQDEVNTLKLELFERKSDINQIILDNTQNMAKLTYQLNKCCRNKLHINLESHIMKILNDLFNKPNFWQNQKSFINWLHTMFITKQDLEWQLMNLTQNLNSEFESLIQKNSKKLMDEITNKITTLQLNQKPIEKVYSTSTTTDFSSIDDERIKAIVKHTLKIYDADKTGLVDYAMEPMGGQIVTTKCTETYQSGSAVVSVLGIPLWYPSNSPRIVITPGINPGECWAFQNFPGFLVIKLATSIKVEAFTVEHISKLLVPGGSIDSALKEFEVYGLLNENDKEPVKLGQYIYDDEGDSLQYFLVVQQQNHEQNLIFDMIEIRIISNHGNPNYTCLYRFRVHGDVVG